MVLGTGQVVGLLGVSPSLAPRERAEAHDLGAIIGIEVVEIDTHEGENVAYRANGPDRCFHCKNELFARIDAEAVTSLGLVAVAYGEIADDAVAGDRPGADAATAHAVLRPLAAAGFTKLELRNFAFAVGLPNWDKPAAPCLASRIPFRSEVTPEKLHQVARLEGTLRDWGFDVVRVRHHGPIARIEVTVDQLGILVADPWRTRVLEAAREAGFGFATLDLAGLQSGAFARLEILAGHD
jgi:uncharacterized protein